MSLEKGSSYVIMKINPKIGKISERHLQVMMMVLFVSPIQRFAPYLDDSRNHLNVCQSTNL